MRQLWGGPEHGNVVSSEEARFACHQITKMWLDGKDIPSSETLWMGYYEWSEERGLYLWDGPGADGDTIERMQRV